MLKSELGMYVMTSLFGFHLIGKLDWIKLD